ncbi:MAG: DUF1080 domain-containing protein [Candidatus Nealsonbacteria bacterium]|nr:DUF1080 domain-containing protein [Candidatus Nealsonbacteria bacterium]
MTEFQSNRVFTAMAIALVATLLLTLPSASAAAEADGGASRSPSDAAPVPVAVADDGADAASKPRPTTCRPKRCKARDRVRSILQRCRRGRCGKTAVDDTYAWKDLFDGKTLDGWKVPEFGGEGEVSVKDGAIVMEMGSAMTGVTYTGELPTDNYEFAWEGARLDGIDFFAAATFPVGKEHCSFVTGGWGGMVVGLSCVNYYDASDNETTKFFDFKDKRWYKFRVRVTPAKIEVWIDDEQFVDVTREGKTIGIRDEADLCRPLGIGAWCTTGGVRAIRIRKLPPG